MPEGKRQAAPASLTRKKGHFGGIWGCGKQALGNREWAPYFFGPCTLSLAFEAGNGLDSCDLGNDWGSTWKQEERGKWGLCTQAIL